MDATPAPAERTAQPHATRRPVSDPVDINLAVLCGRLASEPELRVFDSGSRVMRLLVTVGAVHPRRRIDVVPVTVWDPPDDLVERGLQANTRVWVTGAVQRRFVDGPEGRRGRLEVVADQVTTIASGPSSSGL